MQARSIILTLTLLAVALGVHASKVNTGAKVISEMELDEAPLSLAFQFLRQKSEELDANGNGYNFLIDSKVDQEKPITMKLRNVPVGVAIGYVTEVAGVNYEVDRHAIKILPRSESASPKYRDGSPEQVAKARRLQIDHVEFEDTPLIQVAGFLSDKSVELDPEKKGVNLLLADGVDPNKEITLLLNDVPLTAVISYVAELADVKVQPDRWAFVFQAKPEKTESPQKSATSVF